MKTLENIQWLAAVLCCSAALLSCSEESIITNNGRHITFKAEDNWGDAPAQSRATMTTSKDGTFSVEVITVDEHSTRATGEDTPEPITVDYGVYADYDDGSGSGVQQFMNNQKVNPDGTYDPVKYWSADPTDKYLFYAYAPHVENTTDNSNIINESAATVTYKIGKDDIIWAEKINGKDVNSNGNHQLNSTEGQAGVKFNFVHKTSQLCFKFVNNTDESVVPVSISIAHAVSEATLDIKTGELTLDETSYPLLLKPDKEGEWTVAAGKDKTLNFYIIPDNDKRLEFELKMADKTYTIGGEGSELNVTPEVGKSYLITLKFE